MIKILYGVAGEGMGHAIRGKVIIRHLSKKHDIVVVSSRNAYEFLAKYFNNVHCIHGLHISYKNNKVQNIKTCLQNAYRLPRAAPYTFKKLIKVVKDFKPDVVISDFEPFTNLIAKRYRLPLISIDSMHIMTNCRVRVPKRYYKDYLAAKLVIKSFIVKADYYLINTFFYPEIKKKNTFLFPPVLRDEILKAKVKNKEHILVYQTSKTNKKLKKILNEINEKFIVYGMDEEKEEGNIIFKKFSENGFMEDMALCKALIANGGFGTITESVHLGKPVLSIPIKKQFEQILNAIFVEKMGYGEFHRKLNVKKIDGFISNIDVYRENLKKYKREGNSRILRKLESILSNIKS